MAGVAGRGHEGMLGGTHVRRTETAAHVVRGMTRAAVGSGQIRNMGGREQRVLRHVIVVPGQNRATAVARAAAAVDARVQDGNRRQSLIVGHVDVTNRAGGVARIRHVARGQCIAVPVRRGVANAAVVRRHHLARVVIGRAALQPRARRAHRERQARFVTRVAGRGHEGVLGRSHIHRSECAHRISARGMAGTAVGAGQIGNVIRGQHRVLGRVVIRPRQRRDGVAVAEPAVALDAGVQHGVRRERRGRVVARR